MGTKYLDHGSYPAWALTPTWGVPMDGDGTATTVSGASATVAIDMSGATAVAANTFSVMGAVLTCVASGATVNQFNAGTGTTLIDNLVAAINRTTNTSSVAAQAASWATGNPLNKVVFARRTGNNLEIMTRAGSATYNGLTAVAWVGITGLTGPYTWAGGVSGCWGQLVSDAVTASTPWGASYYGCMIANCIAGTKLTFADTLWVCANNNAMVFDGLTISANADFNLIVDSSNAVWAGTLGKTFTIELRTSAGGPLEFRLLGAGRYSFRATTKGGLVIYNAATFNNSDFPISIGFFNAGGSVFWSNTKFWDNSVRSWVNPCAPVYAGGGDKQFTMHQCEFKTSRAGSPKSIAGSYSVGNSMTVIVDDCDIVYDAMTGTHPGFMGVSNGSYRVTNSRFTGAAIMPPFAKATGAASACVCFAENLSGFNLNSATIGFAANSTSPFGSAEQCVALMQHIGPNKAYRYESNTQLIDWIPGSGYPTLSATMPDGTPWSLRANWLGGALAHSFGAISTSAVLTKRAPQSDAVRTVTMEILLNSVNASSVTNAMLCLDVSYTDDTGAVRTQTTRQADWLFNAGSALSSSAAAWVKNSYSATHNAYKLEITTTYPVKSGSDVVGKLMMLTASPTTGTDIFVEPELGIV